MKTYEHPDEIFQTLEIAHYDVFGFKIKKFKT